MFRNLGYKFNVKIIIPRSHGKIANLARICSMKRWGLIIETDNITSGSQHASTAQSRTHMCIVPLGRDLT